MNHLNDLDNEELLSAHAQLSGKLMQRYLSEEEQTQLREMQEELLRRMTAAAESHCRMGVRCPEHDNQVHGQEAHELRVEIEKFIEVIDVPERSADVSELQAILDRVDCRDSFAYEQKNDQQARREQAEKVSLSVEGLDLLRALRVLTDDSHPARQQLQDKGLIFMLNVDGVCLTILGAQTLEKLDAEDAEPKSRFQSTAFLATDIETEGV